jgi:hypothetical protein
VKTGWSKKSARIIYRRIWLKNGWFADDDDEIHIVLSKEDIMFHVAIRNSV